MGNVIRQLATIFRSIISARKNHHSWKTTHDAGQTYEFLVLSRQFDIRKLLIGTKILTHLMSLLTFFESRSLAVPLASALCSRWRPLCASNGLINFLWIETDDYLTSDESDRGCLGAKALKFVQRCRILADITISKGHAPLRKILFRSFAKNSAGLRKHDNHHTYAPP